MNRSHTPLYRLGRVVHLPSFVRRNLVYLFDLWLFLRHWILVFLGMTSWLWVTGHPPLLLLININVIKRQGLASWLRFFRALLKRNFSMLLTLFLWISTIIIPILFWPSQIILMTFFFRIWVQTLFVNNFKVHKPRRSEWNCRRAASVDHASCWKWHW